VDVGAKAEIYRLIFELTEKGHAMVLISTEMPELLALCDRIEVMHRGEMVRGFDRKEASSDKILAAAMGVTK
jgi:ABC-type sugar transport system ATPase subunit